MMYSVYIGFNTEDENDFEVLAICTCELSKENLPGDYFKPRHDKVKRSGELEIEGDTHLLPASFSVK